VLPPPAGVFPRYQPIPKSSERNERS
jgi:hypothetical protein